MREEVLEILKMVRDGIITVEEAERLLKALEEKDKKSYSKEPFHFTHSFFGQFLNNLASSISSFIKTTMEDIFGETFTEEEKMQEFKISESKFNLPDVESLKIVVKKRGNVKLTSSSDEYFHLKSPSASMCKIFSIGKKYLFTCVNQDLEMEIPDHLKFLMVLTYGGNINVENIKSICQLKTMGGNIALLNPSREFAIKTMGGSINIKIPEPILNSSKAITMGGNINVFLSPELKLNVNAKTMGGSIEIDPELPLSLKRVKRGFGPQSINFEINGKIGYFSLILKTMGGDIFINKLSNNFKREIKIENQGN